MICPDCGKELESGELWARGMWTYFLPEDAKKLNLLSTDGIEKRGGIVLHDPYGIPGDGECSAWKAAVCRKCRKIVIEY